MFARILLAIDDVNDCQAALDLVTNVAAEGAAEVRALHLRVRTGGTWSGWTKVAGTVYGDTALTRRVDGRLDAYAWAGSAIVHATVAAPGGRWSAWYSLGVTIASGPGAGVLADRTLVVLAASDNGSLYHTRYAAGHWSGWTRAFAI